MIRDLIDYSKPAYNHEFQTIQCQVCGHLHTVPVYCGNRFCEICSRSRMMRIKFRLKDLMEKISLKPGENFSHLVLTIKSEEDADAMVNKLIKSFAKLRSRKFFKKNFSGGAYVLELTYSDNGWHPHIHAIVQNRYYPQGSILSAWREIVGKGGIFVKRIPKNAIINYLSKYMCKTELSEEKRVDAGNILKGRRLFVAFGKWHDLLPGWSKIPYHCPQCDAVCWRPLLHPTAEEESKAVTDLLNKYG